MGERIKITAKKPLSTKENSASNKQKTGFRSLSSHIGRILFLQRTIGNQAVQRLIKSGALQAKLRIGQLGDVYEQEARLVGHTLELYVVERTGRNRGMNRPSSHQTTLSGRFRTLVQRLLPGGYRFELHWELPTNPYNSGFYRAELTQTGPGFSSDPSWKRELQHEVALSIRGSSLRFSLEDGTTTIVGAFNPTTTVPGGVAPLLRGTIPGSYGRLDVRDFERLRDQIAANFLAHELREQRARQWGGSSFQSAHREAVLHETDFMGGKRQEDMEHITNGVDFNNPPASPWQWWIPYERMDGSIVAAVLHLQGSNIVSSRTAGFPSRSQFSSAASAQGLEIPAES